MEEEASNYFFKICMTGEFGVGKSSLIMRYVEGNFIQEIGKTTEFEHKVKKISKDGKSIKLRICDSVGEERFSALTASFFRGAHVVVFTFDVTNKESAENLLKWYEEVNRYVDASNLPKVIAANKYDLEENNKQIVEENIKIVDKLAKEWNCSLIKCSAKTGEGVEKLFEVTLPSAVSIADNQKETLKGSTKNANNSPPLSSTTNTSQKKGKCIIL